LFCLIFSLFSFNKYKNTGNVQTFTTPHKNTYIVEVWGAQGGASHNDNGYVDQGGKGGYSKGSLSLNISSNLYICIGQKGGTITGGYNGGGTGTKEAGSQNIGSGGGGGGATSITTTNRGVLKNYNSYRNEIIIVAGAGGGAKETSGAGGGGGGISGEDGLILGGYGGTQKSFGANYDTTGTNGGFGYGGSAYIGNRQGGSSAAGGGGGGYFGGGAGAFVSGSSSGSGGGGSGYIGGVSNGITTSGVQSGNGKAVITWHPIF
jgi:hypothetical protein